VVKCCGVSLVARSWSKITFLKKSVVCCFIDKIFCILRSDWFGWAA
jgi:hypothetical protein